MNALAAANVPVTVPAIPLEWIASGVITPVSGVASPAAMVPTGWSPQPVMTDEPTAGAAIRDAVLSSMGLGLAQAPQVVQSQQPLQQLAMTAPAQQFTALPQADPTLVGSVAGAVAGFASATGRTVSDIAGAGISKARRAGTELWAGVRNPKSIHVSQVQSKYNAAPAPGNKDCGPASVVMTLKLLGKSIPGTSAGVAPQKLINRVRQLAGNATNTASTTNHELERALVAAGTSTREIADGVSIREAVTAGKPVILNGNPRHPGAYGPKFSASQMTPYDGAHWVVVSGIDESSGKFIVNDPLSKIGPVKVTPTQLEAYRGGSIGIEVSA